MSLVDRSAEVRRGEKLNAVVLQAYLRDIVPEVHDGLEIKQFPGGFSNLTYLLQAGERELVLRRPPHGTNVAGAHDMGREYRVISGLQHTYGRVPAPVHYCADATVIGAPFYLMERLRGVILRAHPPRDANLDPDIMRRLSAAFISNLAELHDIDPAATGLTDLGRPKGYVSRQVAGWIHRYEKAATESIADMEATARWLSDHHPAESSVALIHNDYKYDNLVLDANDLTKIVGVLDWEMATIGDPLMDLGSTLAYWVQPDDPARLRQFGLTWLPGNFNRRELVSQYAKISGRALDDVLFYYRYGCFKLAVILQQIYARFHAGHTSDPRFAGLIDVVRICARQAVRDEL